VVIKILQFSAAFKAEDRLFQQGPRFSRPGDQGDLEYRILGVAEGKPVPPVFPDPVAGGKVKAEPVPGRKIGFRVKSRRGREQEPEEEKEPSPPRQPELKPGVAGKSYHDPFNIGIIGEVR
jgi:hypothetical protein